MKTALLCIGLLSLLLFGLGIAISATRNQTRKSVGYPDDPTATLHKLCRAHANAAEYIPILCILMFLLAAPGEPAPWVLAIMVLATASRYLHAIGMVGMPTLARPNLFRVVGAGGTYVAGVTLTVALLLTV
jgi:uncharacterized membrane protein YecN with MAPEG domain